jgi:hypothetical protein
MIYLGIFDIDIGFIFELDCGYVGRSPQVGWSGLEELDSGIEYKKDLRMKDSKV